MQEKLDLNIDKLFGISQVKVLAGDVAKGNWTFKNGILTRKGYDPIILEGELTKFEIQTEQSSKQVAQALGWAAIGTLLGPLGIISGLILGGNRKLICALMETKSGLKYMAVMPLHISDELRLSMLTNFHFNPPAPPPTNQ